MPTEPETTRPGFLQTVLIGILLACTLALAWVGFSPAAEAHYSGYCGHSSSGIATLTMYNKGGSYWSYPYHVHKRSHYSIISPDPGGTLDYLWLHDDYIYCSS